MVALCLETMAHSQAPTIQAPIQIAPTVNGVSWHPEVVWWPLSLPRLVLMTLEIARTTTWSCMMAQTHPHCLLDLTVGWYVIQEKKTTSAIFRILRNIGKVTLKKHVAKHIFSNKMCQNVSLESFKKAVDCFVWFLIKCIWATKPKHQHSTYNSLCSQIKDVHACCM